MIFSTASSFENHLKYSYWFSSIRYWTCIYFSVVTIYLETRIPETLGIHLCDVSMDKDNLDSTS